MRTATDDVEILLEQVDPARNCFRHYGLRIEPDLFEACALVVTWGRIGRAPRSRIAAGGSREAVEAVMQRILRKRESHGYVPVPPSSSSPLVQPGAKGVPGGRSAAMT